MTRSHMIRSPRVRNTRVTARGSVTSAPAKGLWGRIDQESDAEGCHIIFISTSEEGRLRALLDYLRDRPILTIADMPNFARARGIINLKTVEDRIQFDINVDVANAADLKLSSELLRLGNIISADAM